MRNASPRAGFARAREAVRRHWVDRHYRNGNYLMLNSVVGAAAGLAFWLVLVRLYQLPERDIGIGGAAISLCTAFALVAKGGLDSALVRHVPRATRSAGLRLLGLAASVGLLGVGLLVLLLAAGPRLLGIHVPGLTAPALALVAGLAALLVATWLQDAHFLAEGEARYSFYRNLVLHAVRLASPGLVLALALPYPIPVAWGLALGASAVVAAAMLRRMPDHREPLPEGHGLRGQAADVPPRVFLRSAARNVTGGAAEFLPGLLLPPLVLHLQGAEQSAYFYIAWTGASLLFMLSASIARSTFAEMARHGQHAVQLRKAARHHLLIVAPASLLAIAAAPLLLGLFGPGYARNSLGVFWLLAGSIVLLAPVYLYLALLRSREDRWLLVLFPAVNVGLLFLLAPWLEERLGLAGVGLAWLGAHAPLALFATVQLRRATAEEVTHVADTPPGAHRRAPHLE
jgi:O-antigen/teichoic acid export membrane protein